METITVENVCRLCLSQLNQFSEPLSNWVDKVLLICGLEMFLDDGLPQQICLNCHHTLMTATKFRDTVYETDMLLKTYHKTDIKPNLENDEIRNFALNNIINRLDDISDVNSNVNNAKLSNEYAIEMDETLDVKFNYPNSNDLAMPMDTATINSRPIIKPEMRVMLKKLPKYITNVSSTYCSICLLAFADIDQFYTHLNFDIHNTNKCISCHTSCENGAQLWKHIMSVHVDIFEEAESNRRNFENDRQLENRSVNFTDAELFMLALILDEEEEEQNKKRTWVDQAWKNRTMEFTTLYRELMSNEQKFYDYFKMSENTFNILLSKLEASLKKQDTHWRKAISPRERLAVCLRYLVTGDTITTVSLNFRMGQSTVNKIVRETCRIIFDKLKDELMPAPTEEMWRNIAEDFDKIHNFPNCIGAIDGKHVFVQPPPNSGPKNLTSVILIVLVDARNNFTFVDIEENDKNIAKGIFAKSKLGIALQQGTLNIPSDSMLPNSDTQVPYVLVGDETFPLKTYLMRPYPGVGFDHGMNNFNHRLSIARRVSENAFSILCQKFRIYNRRIQGTPKHVDYIIWSTCLLHNFVQKYDRNECNNVEMKSDSKALVNLRMQGGNATVDAFSVREKFNNFFTSNAGSLPCSLNSQMQ